MSDQWDKLKPAGSDDPSTIDDTIGINNEALDRMLSNYRSKVRLTKASDSTISAEAGELVMSNAAGTVRRLRKNTTATTIAWTEIDTGAEANSTVYYVYGIADTDIEGFTFMISASSSAPTGATYYKKIGSFFNNAGGNINKVDDFEGFVDRGDPTAVDFSAATLTTDATWRDLDLSSIVPAGAKSAVLELELNDNAISAISIRRNGNTNSTNMSFRSTQVVNQLIAYEVTVPLDINRIAEYNASNVTWATLNITVKGWWY